MQHLKVSGPGHWFVSVLPLEQEEVWWRQAGGRMEGNVSETYEATISFATAAAGGFGAALDILSLIGALEVEEISE